MSSPDAALNCTSTSQCAESTSGCRGTVFNALADQSTYGLLSIADGANDLSPSVQCHQGLTGVLCQSCDRRNLSASVYYAPATPSRRAQCKWCEDLARNSIIAYCFAAFGLMLALMALILLSRRYLSARGKRQLAAAWLRFTPKAKFKIVASFYLIVTKVDTVCIPTGA